MPMLPARLLAAALLLAGFAVSAFAQENEQAFDSSRALEVAPAPAPAWREAGPLAATYASDSCGRWDDQFGLRGVNGTVRAVVVIGTDVYVAGIGINQAGGVPVSNIARWDGTSWSSIGSTTGQLSALATNGTDLFVGGTFSTIGGVAAENLARWNGVTWSRMWTTNNGGVTALAVRGADLYVGGNFNIVNGNLAASNIVRWNGSAWSALGTGLRGSCYALAWGADTLYAAGNFTVATTGPGDRVAKWDGSAWSPMGSGLSAPAHSLCVDGADVYAGGEFLIAGGAPAARIAKWNGSSWSPLSSGVTSSSGVVRAIRKVGGDLYIAGTFTVAGGVNAKSVARWDGVSWSAMGPSMFGVSTVGWALTARPDGLGGEELLLGGIYDGLGGVTTRGIARWNGAVWSPIDSGNGVGGFINWLSWGAGGSASGQIYAAGSFIAAGNINANYVARYDVATHEWAPLGTGMNAPARAVAVKGDTVYAGGTFTQAGGVNAVKVAMWNGSAWSAMGAGMNNQVEILAVAPNGDVYAGGLFTTAGVVNASRIARWNGTAWSALGAGVNSAVEEIVFGDNGAGGFDVYVAGQFTLAGGLSANRIAKWNGSAWSAFGAGLDNGVDNIVDALWVDPRVGGGYDVYVGGIFLNAGGAPANRIAKWDGTAWSQVGGGVNASVNALTMHNGVLYAGGNLTFAGTDSAYGVAAWDGSAWSRLGRGVVGSGPDAIIVSDTSVYLGGYFSNVGCVPSANFARYSLANPLLAVDDPSHAAPRATPVALSQNAPNPFRASTTIAFRLPDARHVSVRVHDIAGREVAILADGVMSAGRHELRFDARDLRHGVYFYSLRAGALVESRKMLIVR